MDELVVYIREAVDRKQENMRRRRRRDALRLQLVKVLQNIAQNGTFGVRYVHAQRKYFASSASLSLSLYLFGILCVALESFCPLLPGRKML